MLRSEDYAGTAGFNEKKDPRRVSKRLVRSVITCRDADDQTSGPTAPKGLLAKGARVGPILNTRSNTLPWSPKRMVEYKVAGDRDPDTSFVDDVASRYKYTKFGVGWIDTLSTKETGKEDVVY